MMSIISLMLAILICQTANSQSIGVNTSEPDTTAILDITANNKGILIPRLTTLQRSAITEPAIGLQIYNVDIQCLQFYNGTQWMNCCGTPEEPVTEADAGPDRITTADTIHLDGNEPGFGESGMWTISSGSGGSFSDPTDPMAVFSSNGNFETYILRWTVFNPCGSTWDEVELRFYQNGIYVSFVGSDVDGDGSPGNPYRTIQKGIDESLNANQTMIFVSEGTFQETLSISGPSDTIHVRGGHYAYDWNVYDPDAHSTVILGGSTAFSVSNSGAFPITLEYLQIFSSNATSGQNSVVIQSNAAKLIVQECILYAGNGGAGLDGTNGLDGLSGSSGDDGNIGNCTVEPIGGTGGTGGAVQVNGGNGGQGANGDNNNGPGPSGQNGLNGSGPASGNGGLGGPGVGPCMDLSCNTPSGEPDGNPGEDGGNGLNGAGGNNLSFAGGMLTAQAGSSGTDGSGGGGGGGGGGCGGLENCNGSGSFGYGNSGGGGGGAGGAGSAGSGGSGGGSSIGIFAVNTILTVSGSILYRGQGGSGGSGGKGGNGGLGGDGGNGVVDVVGGVFSLSGSGGKGGNGGLGGAGGGGMGGSSIGIARNGGTINEAGNSFVGGQAGSGGKSLGNDGSPGMVINIFGS